jgi:AraC-like DNA-binding protein
LAHRLLSDPVRGGVKISTVALDSGFGDLSYFNRTFRRRYGMAPSELRAAADTMAAAGPPGPACGTLAER